jgi:hypothetical protein
MKLVTPLTPNERTRKHRDRRKEEGWRLVQVYLEPRSTAIIERMVVYQGMTTAEAINRCVISHSMPK